MARKRLLCASLFHLIFCLLGTTAFAQSPDCREWTSRLEQANFSHGFVTTPENSSDPSGSPKLQIFYWAWLPKTSSATPVVFFNGGPGFSSHALFDLWAQILPQLNIPFVIIDQRGTGCSSPYPRATDTASMSRLRFYGSRGIVEDAEAVRRHLFGAAQWKIFGQSYGAHIVHRYLTTHPQSVTAAFAHGMALSRHPLGEYYFRVLGQNRIVEKYLNSHPEDRQKMQAVRNQLAPDHCYHKASFEVCGEGVWDGILVYWFGSNASAEVHSTLPKLVDSSGKLNEKLFSELVEKNIFSLYAPDRKERSIPGISGPAYIGMMEFGGQNPSFDDPFHCRSVNLSLSQQGLDVASMPLNECRFVLSMRTKDSKLSATTSLNSASSAAGIHRDPLSLDEFGSAIRALPRGIFHLYSGALDTFVPSELFIEESMELANWIRYTDFPESAHEGFWSEPQIWSDLLGPHLQ